MKESTPVNRFIIAILLKYFIELSKEKATIYLLHPEETLLMYYGFDEVKVEVMKANVLFLFS